MLADTAVTPSTADTSVDASDASAAAVGPSTSDASVATVGPSPSDTSVGPSPSDVSVAPASVGAEAGAREPDVGQDSVRACARELGTLFRRVKRLAGAQPAGGAALERPAYGLLLLAAERGAVRLTTLADAVPADLSTISRQVAALETAGWLVRERDPEDRRAFLVRVTPGGQDALTRTVEAHRAQLGDLLTDWTETDRREFARLLGHFNATIEERLGGNAPCARKGQE